MRKGEKEVKEVGEEWGECRQGDKDYVALINCDSTPVFCLRRCVFVCY